MRILLAVLTCFAIFMQAVPAHAVEVIGTLDIPVLGLHTDLVPIRDSVDTGGLGKGISGLDMEDSGSPLYFPWILDHSPGDFSTIHTLKAGDEIHVVLFGTPQVYSVVKVVKVRSQTWGKSGCMFCGVHKTWNLLLTTCAGSRYRTNVYAVRVS